MSEHAPSLGTELTLPKGGALPAGHAMVFERAGAVFANSRDVADFFGKRHDHVLRDIRHLIVEGVPNFGEGSYTLPETGPQTHPCFDMTRDGFSLLAMGFTGKKALKWKLLYIGAFNKMESELRARAAPVAIDLSSNGALLALANDLVQAILAERAKTVTLIAENAALAPKAVALAVLADAEGSLTLTDVAKSLSMQRAILIDRLRGRWIYRRTENGPWIGFQPRIDAGHLVHKLETVTQSDGKERVRSQVRVTAKGLAVMAKHFAAEAST
jgi:Rha family phage regulatory protein